MTLPGTYTTVVDAASTGGAPTDTGRLFPVGTTDRGPTTPQAVHSIGEWRAVYGPRTDTSAAIHDYVEAYFAEGGGTVVTARVVGATATVADVDLAAEGGGGTSLTVSAESVGEWGNDLQVAVEDDPAGFQVVVLDGDDVELERSGPLASREDAVAYGERSTLVNLALGADTAPPAVADATALTGGAAAIGSLTDTHWQTGLDTLDRQLGPGQVVQVGRSTVAAHTQTLTHARDRGRFALLDAGQAASVTDLLALAASIRALGSGAEGLPRSGMLFAQWATIPGLVAGSTRRVPYSAIYAGRQAAIDREQGPQQPAAGGFGDATYATGLVLEVTDADRERLNDAGVNAAVMRLDTGRPRLMGNVTTDSRVTSQWWAAHHSRIVMALNARGHAIAETYVHRGLDGKGVVLSEFNGRLASLCADFYRDGALYGAEPAEAFRVNTGPDVNPRAQLAAGILAADLEVVVSPAAEVVRLRIAKHPTDTALAA